MRGLIRRLYSLPDPEIASSDIVIPLSQALLSPQQLPDASVRSLQEAARIARKFNCPIAWSSANFFWPDGKETEDSLKRQVLRSFDFSSEPIIASQGATNTVTEALAVREALCAKGYDLRGKRIVAVTDWRHARSVKLIFEWVFPDSVVFVRSVDGKWNENHPAFFARSEWRWLFINLLRHMGLILLGPARMNRFKQPKS